MGFFFSHYIYSCETLESFHLKNEYFSNIQLTSLPLVWHVIMRDAFQITARQGSLFVFDSAGENKLKLDCVFKISGDNNCLLFIDKVLVCFTFLYNKRCKNHRRKSYIYSVSSLVVKSQRKTCFLFFFFIGRHYNTHLSEITLMPNSLCRLFASEEYAQQ